MIKGDERRRTRKAAVLQLAAEVLRRSPRRDRDVTNLVRALERAAAGELVGSPGDPAAAV
jgi:hypothetical protein